MTAERAGASAPFRVCEAFEAVCALADAAGAAPLNACPGCWQWAVDAQWSVAINAHANRSHEARGLAVPSFHCAVWFNGWPAGLFGPSGGAVAAGELANEEALITALRDAAARLACGAVGSASQ